MSALNIQPIDLEQFRRESAKEATEMLHDHHVHPVALNHNEDGPPDQGYDHDVGSDANDGGDIVAGETERQAEAALWTRLEEEHGTAVGYGKNGEVNQIGENFWAARYRHEQPIIFDDGRGSFYRYEAGVYHEVSEDQIRKGLADLMLRIRRLMDVDGLEKFRNSRQLGGIITTLRGQTAERDPFACRGPRFVVVANGVLLLNEDGGPELVPHDCFYRSTHGLSVNYDPQAQCPRFEEELLSP